MSIPVYRRDDIPPESGPALKIVRLKACESCNVSLLGSCVVGYWTHWGTRTLPCTLPREECEGCRRQFPQRWKGYIHCLREDRTEEGFLEVTKITRETILEHVGGEKFLRGSRIKVLRGKGDKTTLRVLLLRPWAAEHPDIPLPDEKSPEQTLRALFEFGTRKANTGKDGAV